MTGRMNWGKIKSHDAMWRRGSDSMSGEIPKGVGWALSEPQRRRGKPDLKSQLAAKLKLSLEEQIFLGLVEPINVERMTRHVRKKPPRGES